MLISLVIFTTIHALDFKDIEGDGLIGRRTLPILYPLVSRLCTAALIPFWSLLLAYHYRDASPLISLGTIVLGLSTGARFAWKRTREADRTSGVLYNVSLHSVSSRSFADAQCLGIDLALLPACHPVRAGIARVRCVRGAMELFGRR